MSPEEFRAAAHEVVDWMADYLRDIRDYPVLPNVQPGDTIDALPAQGPEHGEPMPKILEDFRNLIVPGLTHWNHPRFSRLFLDFRVRSRHPGRDAGRDHEHSAHAVESFTRGHRARTGDARLAAPMVGPARRFLRHHPRHRVYVEHACDPRGARSSPRPKPASPASTRA